MPSKDTDTHGEPSVLKSDERPHGTAVTRRGFIGGSATMLTSAVPILGLTTFSNERSAEAFAIGPMGPEERRNAAFRLRVEVAFHQKLVPIPPHHTNGDELRYPSKIGSYTKGLPHGPKLGEVLPDAYRALIRGLERGTLGAIDEVPLGGGDMPYKLVDPLSGLAFQLEGTDSHQLSLPPPPTFASAEEAGEIVENYWMALLRDVPFAQYEDSPLAHEAAKSLSQLYDFRGPKVHGHVTPQTLFRAPFPGALVGPYVSQFKWLDAPLGTNLIEMRVAVPARRQDFMTTYSEWLAIQNGRPPTRTTVFDPQRRYIITGRDLGENVHYDADSIMYSHYLCAMAALINIGAPLNPGNPYHRSKTQVGFATFGGPHGATLLAEVVTRALKAVWFQKWFVHRRVRPESFAGRVNLNLLEGTDYPVNPEVYESGAIGPTFDYNAKLNEGDGSVFLSQAYPEGAPLHPAYGSGHATAAGAAVTMLKAFFDGSYVLPDPVVPDPEDPTHLVPYSGPELTVNGELDKLAYNIAFGRNIAGVHWRSDAVNSLLLGEAVAISILRDQKPTFVQPFAGFTFRKFDGRVVIV